MGKVRENAHRAADMARVLAYVVPMTARRIWCACERPVMATATGRTECTASGRRVVRDRRLVPPGDQTEKAQSGGRAVRQVAEGSTAGPGVTDRPSCHLVRIINQHGTLKYGGQVTRVEI
jgi:hypothetical protein